MYWWSGGGVEGPVNGVLLIGFQPASNSPARRSSLTPGMNVPVQTLRCLCRQPVAMSRSNEARSPARSSKKGEKYEADATIGLGSFASRWLLDRGGAGDAAHGAMGRTPRFSILCSRSGLGEPKLRSEVQVLHYARRHGRPSTEVCARYDADRRPVGGQPVRAAT